LFSVAHLCEADNEAMKRGLTPGTTLSEDLWLVQASRGSRSSRVRFSTSAPGPNTDAVGARDAHLLLQVAKRRQPVEVTSEGSAKREKSPRALCPFRKGGMIFSASWNLSKPL